jgi:hypothetical protein
MTGYIEITKAEFYAWGGFSNPHLARKMISGKWHYYREIQ